MYTGCYNGKNEPARCCRSDTGNAAEAGSLAGKICCPVGCLVSKRQPLGEPEGSTHPTVTYSGRSDQASAIAIFSRKLRTRFKLVEGFELSEHAHNQMQERNVKQSWLDETLSAPERILPLADPHGNTHYLRRIKDFGDRWLRVVVNPNAEPKRIVTIFFDRRVK